ncbi:uncharacterized protein EI90DRAFT_3038954 [Cantharellus anzutake]|uniref:uncharacterized protein n=1 Tax=Cantharellus anzutake TaxID=1750568 RepID=UPI0019086A2A|nr:uncharacterized protein EI90DRAFT_3038954 [Cantharellus anzutake]KAF8338748.1 hypothetical protein EI90DRAFT_3038954 [Cantharellus anzutake]
MLSPRKTVPLATGEPSSRIRGRSDATQVQITHRTFFCSVVFEGGNHGKPLSPDVKDVVASLGTRLSEDGKPAAEEIEEPSDSPANPAESASEGVNNGVSKQKRPSAEVATLVEVLNELVRTERSYVRKLHVLKRSYADPLRSFARAKDTAIIPPYEAKTMFGNLDSIILANETLLADLELMLSPNGPKQVGGIGDVLLKHFKDARTFDCYKQYYSKIEEAQSIFESLKKSNSGFSGFIERIKYSTSDSHSRIGLRELLIEPVQRIPRYTLFVQQITKYMPEKDPQRARVLDAEQAIASIGKCEAGDETRRFAVMSALQRSIDGFPHGLISNSRNFIDCIDVDDVPVDLYHHSGPSGSSSTLLPCTLFLFDDKLMIAKRHTSSSSGRALAGLDEADRLAKSGILNGLTSKRNAMSCKGVVDITEVVATDPGSIDIHIYLEQEPPDQSDRWTNRPFRSLSVVCPSAGPQAPQQALAAKGRFLESLWLAQAMYRSKSGRSVTFVSDDKNIGSSSSRLTIARTYFNVYRRMAYLSEPRKGKIVLHIDPSGRADRLPFGIDCGPYVIIRVQPMKGELCRYGVSSSDEPDEVEEEIVHTATVPNRIVHTIHQYGLFRFRTERISRPTTPTPSTRGRATIFNLDAISRNLFNSRSTSLSSKGPSGDDFAQDGSSSGSSHKRSRSFASRASQLMSQTTGTTTTDSFKFSQRSVSTTATSLVEDESLSFSRSRSTSPRKLYKSGRSPSQASSPSKSRESSRERSSVERELAVADTTMPCDESEVDLSMRLELARQNSLSQHQTSESHLRMSSYAPSAESISEEDGSTIRKAPSENSTLRPISPAPTERTMEIPSRPTSSMSIRRQPTGPREPPKSPGLRATKVEHEIERTLSQLGSSTLPRPRTPSPPRASGKQFPLPAAEQSTAGTTCTPSPPPVSIPIQTTGPVEPLSIKKRSSTRRNSPVFKKGASESAIDITNVHNVSELNPFLQSAPLKGQTSVKRSLSLAQEAMEDATASSRALKRIKLEVNSLNVALTSSSQSRSSVTNPGLRTPTRAPPTREAEARLEEMRRLIGQSRVPPSRPESPTKGSFRDDSASIEALKDQILDAERTFKKLLQKHESLISELEAVSMDFDERQSQLERTENELQHARRQCDLVKKLLADATAENEIMYDAFNEELDGMFQDANLPKTEAWDAMVTDLRKAKDDRNSLAKQNSSLKRSLELAQLQSEEWGRILRAHGLIS